MKTLFFILIVLIVNSCSTMNEKKITKASKENDKDKIALNFKLGPTTIIYKTRKDYKQLVPVTLSADKSKIVSYPHPKDIFYNGELAYPTELNNEYLLDNRGINSNVAFLNISYAEYSELDKVPSIDELFEMILDNDPLTEIYNCGNRYTFKNEISDLNRLIENNRLKECKCLVIDNPSNK
ncbi:MAG: hypothetical protein PHP52_07885 [Bacteroidales bacterium]|nr:hypothetical protein [Bacteroidales bacterium]MDD4218299.1 hypothetical protein [Bacteroidales bacterium]MDY0142561.1 hypothetical protein [Bacteroidales bacterium]